MELRVKPCRRRRPGASCRRCPSSAPQVQPASAPASSRERGGGTPNSRRRLVLYVVVSVSVSSLVPASRSPRLRPPPSSSRSTSTVPRLVRTKPRRPLLDRASAGHLRLELSEIAPAASTPLCVPRRRSCFIPARLRSDLFASTPSAAIGTCIPCFVNEETSAAPLLTCCTASVDETTSPVWASSAPRPSLRPAACLHLLTDWV
ncbi:uncharacterized protein LOC119281204 [Triticum dicoccoides]|uniref:uncharacterized protein LOC119281204 n=1 Tax=Triticum dicoccoides TaxID=85692 RepID=UPI00188F528B|nr:uncharacterized protein LOC119281204 [Triticum dicoccoides]